MLIVDSTKAFAVRQWTQLAGITRERAPQGGPRHRVQAIPKIGNMNVRNCERLDNRDSYDLALEPRALINGRKI
jgi:hypothetical protein